ncbi:MAG: TIGR03943 family putative permease subunit [Cyanobium sp.]
MTPRLPPLLQRAALQRGAALALWALVLLRSCFDGRLDLLLRALYHPLVALAGSLLLVIALLQLWVGLRPPGGAERSPRRQGLLLLLGGVLALAVLAVPPAPSFADLAGQRPRDDTAESELSFVLPPAQRSLTDWVRLLRSQSDPRLFEGDPVRISGFVLPVPGGEPELARLLVRCCLADAAPVGLPVRWPPGAQPRADQWLRLEGRMAVKAGADGERLVVVPRRIKPIARPARPLEP